MQNSKSEEKELSEELLMFQLKERYESMHLLRDRIQTISFWILWILLWISWWLTQWNLKLNCIEKSSALVLLLIWIALFFRYFSNLNNWWIHQHECAIELEKDLQIQDKLLPKNYSDNSTRKSIKYYYCFVAFWTIVTIICILHFT